MKSEELLQIAEERLKADSHELVYVAETDRGVVCVYDDFTGEKLIAELNAMKETFVSRIIAVHCGKNDIAVDIPTGKTIKALWELNKENAATEAVLCTGDGSLNTKRLELMIPQLRDVKNEELIRLAEERMNASSCDCISVADTESGVMYNEGDETGEKLVAELEAQGVTCVSKIFVAVKRNNKTLVGQPCHDVIVKIWNMDERNKTAVTLGEGYDGVVTTPISVMYPDR